MCPEPDDANTTAYDQWLASKDDDWKDIHKNDVCIWNEVRERKEDEDSEGNGRG